MYVSDDPSTMPSKASHTSAWLSSPGPTSSYPLPGPARTMSFWRLMRYRRSILLIAGLVALVAIPAIWAFIRPRYTARAEIRVRPIIPVLVFQTEESGIIPLYQSYLNTQVGIIRSSQVLSRVLDRPDVRATAWFGREAGGAAQGPGVVDRVRKDVEVRPRGQTEIIDVTATALGAADAAVLTNAVIDEYIRLVGEMSAQSSDLLYRRLVEEYRSLRDEIEGRQRVVAQLRKELGTDDPKELVDRMRLRLDEAQARLEDLRRRIALNQWQQDEMSSLAQGNVSAELSADEAGRLVWYQQDQEWRRLYLAARTAQHQLEVEGSGLGQRHPKMLAMKADADFAQTLLADRQHQLDDLMRLTGPTTMPAGPQQEAQAYVANDLVTLDRMARQLKYEEQLVSQDVGRQRTSWETTFDDAQVLGRELEVVRQKEDLYTAVRTRLEQKEMERNVPGTIEVLTRAEVPSGPSRDRRAFLTLLALAGGLGAGLGVALLRAARDQSICDAKELARELPAPFIGELPLLNGRPAAEDAPLCEGVRMVRTALLGRLEGRTGSTILIASPDSGAGKTTVAILLAQSLCRCGKRVLLIDGDLRSGTISSRLGLKDTGGLAAALADDHGPCPAATTYEPGPFDVISSPPQGPDAQGELLGNGALARCIGNWREQYDIILLDSPPMLQAADAGILAQHADATLMVVRGGKSRRDELYSAVMMLKDPPRQLLGAVFIGGPRRKYGYGNGEVRPT